jgi:hypothetical protein
MAFKKATKIEQWLRLCIVSPSGGGKTYSALSIATGLLDGTGQRIGMIDTERGSGELYADEFDYDVMQLGPPYSPERYIEAIDEAQAENFGCLIIDSGSHCWMGQGGVLEIADKFGVTSKSPYGGWAKATPEQNKFLDRMLTFPGHLILTLRTKTAYEVQENDRGKKTPVKIGLAPVQRDGIEFEFMTILEMSVEGNLATSSKDRTKLFKDKAPFQPSRGTGKLLKTWLESGVSLNQLFEDLKADAALHGDLKKWYVDSVLKIKMLPAQKQSQLIEEIKTAAAAKAALTQSVGIPAAQAGAC